MSDEEPDANSEGLIQEIEQMLPILTRLSRIDTSNLTDSYQLDPISPIAETDTDPLTTNDLPPERSNRRRRHPPARRIPVSPNTHPSQSMSVGSDSDNHSIMSGGFTDPGQNHGVEPELDSDSNLGELDLDTFSDLDSQSQTSNQDHPLSQNLGRFFDDSSDQLLEKFLSRDTCEELDVLLTELQPQLVGNSNAEETSLTETPSPTQETSLTETPSPSGETKPTHSPKSLDTSVRLPTADFITQCQLFRSEVLANFQQLVQAEGKLRSFLDKRTTMKKSMGNLVEFVDCISQPQLREGFTDYLQQVYCDETDLSQVQEITQQYATCFKQHQDNLVALETLNFFSVKPKCPLCFTNEIDTVCLPCGHSACRRCLARCNHKCGVCRETIKGLQKLFIN